jgi:hypothetical protein
LVSQEYCSIISVISIRTYKDGEYPGKWALGVGLSLGAFGTATYLLGTVALTGGRCGCFISRCCRSFTCCRNNINIHRHRIWCVPSYEWALATGLSMGGSGSNNGNWHFIVGSLGLGMLALIAGTKELINAESIVDVSFILKKEVIQEDLLKIGQRYRISNSLIRTSLLST